MSPTGEYYIKLRLPVLSRKGRAKIDNLVKQIEQLSEKNIRTGNYIDYERELNIKKIKP